MQSITRNCLIVFDLKIQSAPHNAVNFSEENSISLINVSKFGTRARALYQFNRPTNLRAGSPISSALFTLTFRTGAGISPSDLQFVPVSEKRVTVDATWDKYDGVSAWALAGGDYSSEIGSVHEEEAGSGNATAKTYDITAVIERAIALDPNGQFINIIVKWKNELESESVILESYPDNGSAPDAESPTLELTFETGPTTHGTGGSITLAPAVLGLRS